MDDRGAETGEAWRESAAFDVTVADYRRAYALGIASVDAPLPRFWRLLWQSARWYWGRLMGVAAAVAALCAAYFMLLTDPGITAVVDALAIGAKAALVMTGLALALAGSNAWNAWSSYRHFPRLQAQWKRPTRMRVRWNATALVLAGEAGFGSFAWHGLFAWIDAPDTLVVFTAMRDPVPIPHAALAAGDLDDLRQRLTAAEVPAEWSWHGDRMGGLQRVFR